MWGVMRRSMVRRLAQRKGVAGIAALFLCLLALPVAVGAQQGQQTTAQSKFRSGGTVVIAPGETISHDLYVTGGTVRVEGRIEGDLIVAGGTVDVIGPVTGEVIAVGGTVNIGAPVGTHLRVAAGTVNVTGPVGRDLAVTAGTVNVFAPARVAGDVLFAGGQLTLDGTVDGSVLGSAATYTKNGTVRGSESVTIQQADTVRQPAPLSAATRFLNGLRTAVERYLGVLLFGVLLLWLVPRATRAVTGVIDTRPLPSLGSGLLALVGLGVAMIALFVATLAVAIPLGVVGMGQLIGMIVFGVVAVAIAATYLFTLFAAYIGNALVALGIGSLLRDRTHAKWLAQPFWMLALGTLIVVGFGAIPYVGDVVRFVVMLIALGAIASLLWQRRQRSPLAEPRPVMAPSFSPAD